MKFFVVELYDCDSCDARMVPCIPCSDFYMSESEEVSANRCEPCVRRMQAAFDDYREKERARELATLRSYALSCRQMITEFRAFVWFPPESKIPKIPPRLDDVIRLVESKIPGEPRRCKCGLPVDQHGLHREPCLDHPKERT